jgi:hypothetical protein
MIWRGIVEAVVMSESTMPRIGMFVSRIPTDAPTEFVEVQEGIDRQFG